MTEKPLSFVMVRPDGHSLSQSAVIAGDMVLTAQENQVYETVMKVIKEKEALNKSMQENYQKLLVYIRYIFFSLF